tara:strand:+ start:281 stop:1054 length:774 start_codon:yes stop_codon:yes gene_type:complete
MNWQPIAWKDIKSQRNNIEYLPRSIRGLIVGKSGCGKSTLLFQLLLRPEWLDYNNLFVFGKSLHQPEYQIIQKGFECGLSKQQIVKIFEIQENLQRAQCSPIKLIESLKPDIEDDPIKVNYFEEPDDVPDPQEVNAKCKNLFIFDDLLLSKQNKIESYYTRGRHNNVDCFYLSQSYFQLPRRTIRGNSNFLILFKLPKKDLDHIYQDHVSTDMTKEEFFKLADKAWERPHSVLIIDLSSDKLKGKYRVGFDCFYIPN